MAILNDISKRISKTTQSAVKGTKDLADIARLNNLISEEQALLSNFYTQIGEKYYKLYSQTTDEDFAELCRSVTDITAKINGHRDEIHRIKGIRKCKKCGTELPSSSIFCGNCGFDTYEGVRIQPVCPSCNKTLEDGLIFCTNCGQKL